MGILLVYDVTDEASFSSKVLNCYLNLKFANLSINLQALNAFAFGIFILLLLISDIRNWIRNIEQHASDNVNKILVGNKADMDESKRVS